MANTILEQMRDLHEDVESMEKWASKALSVKPPTHRQTILQQHRVYGFLSSAVDKVTSLQAFYQDADSAREDEIKSISTGNIYSQFYDRLRAIREYHRKFPGAPAGKDISEEDMLAEDPWVEFSGEESFGRYLDLHELFSIFINSNFGRKVDYAEYLDNIFKFSDLPLILRTTKEYKAYLDRLLEVLRSFHHRTQPLQNLDTILAKACEEFETKWEEGLVDVWQNQDSPVCDIDLSVFDTAADLELGCDAETIKRQLQKMGLKTGGTPLERANRLLETRGKSWTEISKKAFAKGAKLPTLEIAKPVAQLEAKLTRMGELLQEVLEDTKGNVEKKQSRTFEENMEDAEGEDINIQSDEDDEEQNVYNPLKLPLGWDGKPIPYWLYKLHGLNIQYICEICGNLPYWGRRAFEKHFRVFISGVKYYNFMALSERDRLFLVYQEARHQHGMKCLGIPNTKAFYEITSIQDALALHKEFLQKKDSEWKEHEEEYEDDDGNVYSKKDYEALRKQGII